MCDSVTEFITIVSNIHPISWTTVEKLGLQFTLHILYDSEEQTDTEVNQNTQMSSLK